MKQQIILIAHNLRSCHNVGSLLRTSDGLGLEKVYLTGYTPYPKTNNDGRLPHLAAKINRRIAKTSLGAEQSVRWHYQPDIRGVIKKLKNQGWEIAALEQHQSSLSLPSYQPSDKTALVVGSEVDGLDQDILELCDKIVEIPMLGKKESFNVAVAAAMALHHLRYS